jgi:hypothetical protein
MMRMDLPSIWEGLIINDENGPSQYLSNLDDLLGVSTTSIDFDPSSLEGKIQLQAYIKVRQVSNDTNHLMWWKKHQSEFPDLTRMARQYLTVPSTSVSGERFFSRVGLVKLYRLTCGGGFWILP